MLGLQTEFRSAVEDLKRGIELPVTHTADGVNFGKYRPFFPAEALKHPQKMDVCLLEYLLLKYTKAGQTVLDPFGGTGATAVLAALLGRNAVAVELEGRFFKWMLEAKRKVERAQTFAPKGTILMIHGDARELTDLLFGVNCAPDVVVTSPPYADVQNGDNLRVGSRGYWRSINKKTVLFGQGNLANLGAREYVGAMLQVYGGMFDVLRAGGLALVAMRPYIKGGRVVDLPLETWALLGRAGFDLKEVLKFRLRIQGYWRVLYYKRHRDVPLIAHEYILVVEKPAN